MGSFLSGVTECRVGLLRQGGAGTEGQRPGQWRLGHHAPKGPLKKSDRQEKSHAHMYAHTETWEDKALVVKKFIYSQIFVECLWSSACSKGKVKEKRDSG